MLPKEDTRMSNEREKNKNIGNSDDRWLQLIESYFDATITDAEEQQLRQFLVSPLAEDPQYNEVKAVMGFLSTGKRYNSQPKRTPIRKINSALKWSTAAAIAVGIFGTAALHFGNSNNDICVAYIDGKKYTEEAIVLAQMQNTMQRMSNGIEEHSLEHQLGDIFRTMSNYENENK